MLRICSVLVLVLGLAASLSQAAEPEVRVIDGDTIDLAGQRIRLFGIDAPEKGQICDERGQVRDCGAWSAMMLQQAIASFDVQCSTVDRDRYGRLVSICTANGVDLGAVMVQNGAATAYTRYSRRYAKDEQGAKARGLGIWAGKMVAPETYRHPAPATPAVETGDCAIKGNIGTSGKHIYHLPGQRDYAATRISPAKGEAWFCTEAEAQRAGFRKARR